MRRRLLPAMCLVFSFVAACGGDTSGEAKTNVALSDAAKVTFTAIGDADWSAVWARESKTVKSSTTEAEFAKKLGDCVTDPPNFQVSVGDVSVSGDRGTVRVQAGDRTSTHEAIYEDGKWVFNLDAKRTFAVISDAGGFAMTAACISAGL